MIRGEGERIRINQLGECYTGSQDNWKREHVSATHLEGFVELIDLKMYLRQFLWSREELDRV